MTNMIVNRDIINRPLFSRQNGLKVYIYLLSLKAYKTYRIKNRQINKGEIATTYHKIADTCNITISQAQREVKLLIAEGELTKVKQCKTFCIYTIKEYKAERKKQYAEL